MTLVIWEGREALEMKLQDYWEHINPGSLNYRNLSVTLRILKSCTA